MKILIALLPIVIVGCGYNRAQNVIGPDGDKNYSAIVCSTPATCWKLAGEVCPNGYSVIFGSLESIEKHKSVLIHCKGEAKKMCGGDLKEHGCQGTTRWNEDVWQCEPC